MRTIVLIACFLFLGLTGYAQDPKEADRALIIEQRIEQIAETIESDNIDYSTLFEQLSVYLDFPLNLNTATVEELYSLAFLSNYQIGQLMEFREKYGEMFSIYELPQINGWDVTTAELIEPFVKVVPSEGKQKITFDKMLRRGKNEVLIRYTRTLEEQEGYAYASPEEWEENPNIRYLGSPDKLFTRYRYRYGDRISFGMTAEKDNGEEFFRGTQKQGFDFYSAHLFLKGFGRVKKFSLGDYQAQFGQGLTFWSGLGFNRKSSFTVSTAQAGRGIGPYTSINENLFLRGVATTIGITEHIDASVFYSGKRIDGNRDASQIDSVDFNQTETIITSFQESGFHRTQNEIDDKHAIFQQHIGGNVRLNYDRFRIGITAVHMKLDGEINLNADTYSQFRFSGTENSTAGIDYSWKLRNFFFFGETTRSQNGAMATMNGVNINMHPRLTVNITQRYFARDFQPVASVAFSESSTIENESGVYFGVEFRPFKKWKFNAFYDQFKFPWLKYQVDAPSQGYDFLGQLDYQPSSRFSMYIRYREKVKKINDRDDIYGTTSTTDVGRKNLRFHFSYRTSYQIRFRSRIELSSFTRGIEPRSSGFLLYQDIVYDFAKIPIRLTMRYAIFDSDTYDSRFFAYENDVLYAFSIPSYSGRGSRIYAMVKYDVNRNIDIWLRWGQFYYTDRDEVGSGREAINGNTKSEIKAQVRLKF